MKELKPPPSDYEGFNLTHGRREGSVVYRDNTYHMTQNNNEVEVFLVMGPDSRPAWTTRKPVNLRVVK